MVIHDAPQAIDVHKVFEIHLRNLVGDLEAVIIYTRLTYMYISALITLVAWGYAMVHHRSFSSIQIDFSSG